MTQQSFIGMLVLDVRPGTDVSKITTLLQTVASVFDHSSVINLVSNIQTDTDDLKPTDIIRGACLVASSKPKGELFVPAKRSSVMSWLAGSVVNPEAVHELYSKTGTDQDHMPDILPGKMMLRLNSDRHPPEEFRNYAHQVHSRMTQFMDGRWGAMSIFSGGSRSTVVITRRNLDMYFSWVCLDQCSFLFWGTEHDFLPRLLQAIPLGLPQSFLKYDCLVNHITPLNDKHTLVLHPVFLLTKYHTWGENQPKRHGSPSDFNPLRVFTVFSSYLERLAV